MQELLLHWQSIFSGWSNECLPNLIADDNGDGNDAGANVGIGAGAGAGAGVGEGAGAGAGAAGVEWQTRQRAESDVGVVRRMKRPTSRSKHGLAVPVARARHDADRDVAGRPEPLPMEVEGDFPSELGALRLSEDAPVYELGDGLEF